VTAEDRRRLERIKSPARRPEAQRRVNREAFVAGTEVARSSERIG
jgi:hypothetical protein